jgi:hypothetical protein
MDTTLHATVSYQLYVTDSSYLVSFFPPGGTWEKIPWVVTSTLGWFGLAVENQRSLSVPLVLLIGGLLVVLISANVVITVIRNSSDEFLKLNLFLVLGVLLGGSIVAALIGVYPFGGIRQHLYAAPLIVLCASQSIISMIALTRARYAALILLIGVSLFSAASLILIPRQYREIQDIVSAISDIGGNVSDESVYIYYMSVQAVDFHYPDRRFFRGTPARYEVDVMGNEVIKQIRDCHVYAVFTHVWKTEDEEIIAYLEKSGLTLFEEHKYAGARVLDFTSCQLE